MNVDYVIDAAGNRTGIKWPDAFTASYVYDGLGRVGSVAIPSITLRTYTYDTLSRRTGQVAMPGTNQTATSYAYEADNDLSGITHNYPGATVDLAVTHTTSAAGQLLSTTTSEPLNRYVDGTVAGTKAYAVANPLNQYPSVTPIGGSATTLSYDLNGNLTGDGSSTYTYDATNRLLAIAGFVNASYGYDALDRRMSKTTGATTTRFLHAGSDEIAEYTSAGVLIRRYVPGPGTDERAALIDSGLLSPPASSIRYAHTDRQGSVMAVTDSTGAVSERFAYDGFGRSSASLSGYPFRYTGQRLDPESGLMFYKARVYSQTLGRFLQTDPIGAKDDLNLYAYVGNDPVNKTDPSGMDAYDGGGLAVLLGATAFCGDSRSCQDQVIRENAYEGSGEAVAGFAVGGAILGGGGAAPLLGEAWYASGAWVATNAAWTIPATRFTSQFLDGAEAITPIPVAAVVVPSSLKAGTTLFGDFLHAGFEQVLKDLYPNTRFRTSLKEGMNGVDVTYLGGEFPGFNYAELSAMTDRGLRKYIGQVGRWWNNGEVPKGTDVKPFWYDDNGVIFE